MDHNWPYVAAGYSITTTALVAYTVWLWLRLRRVDRSTSGTDD